MDWEKNNMKVHFQSVLFTDECRATLDGPDGWRRGWYCTEGPHPQRIRRRQGGGGVMFWGAAIGNELVRPFRVSDEVKMTAESLHGLSECAPSPMAQKEETGIPKKHGFHA